MAGIKNIYQKYNAINKVDGKDILSRNQAFQTSAIDVYCRSCGNEIVMPPSQGEGSYPLEIYEIELINAIHQDCARELDRNGINY